MKFNVLFSCVYKEGLLVYCSWGFLFVCLGAFGGFLFVLVFNLSGVLLSVCNFKCILQLQKHLLFLARISLYTLQA